MVLTTLSVSQVDTQDHPVFIFELLSAQHTFEVVRTVEMSLHTRGFSIKETTWSRTSFTGIEILSSFFSKIWSWVVEVIIIGILWIRWIIQLRFFKFLYFRLYGSPASQVQCSGLLKETQSFYLMLKPYGAIVGGAAGVLALVAVVVGFVWFCKLQYKNFSNKNSETGSSDPSAPGKVIHWVKIWRMCYISAYLDNIY